MSGMQSHQTSPNVAPAPGQPFPQQHHHHQNVQQQPPSQYQQPSSQADASAIKLTRGTSCVLCQQRKVRCDKNKPCANCVKAGVDCRVVPPQPPRRRKKRLQERDLIDRLKKYESLLTENGVKFESIAQELRGDSQQGDEVEDLENDFDGLKTSPEASASPGDASSDRPSKMFFNLHKEFRASEKILHDSSDDEDNKGVSTIHRAFDQMFSNQDGFPFLVGGRPDSVTSLHPSTLHIFQLWQIYIDNINTLLKVTHVPTVQVQIVEATSQLDKAPQNIEALMFAIYLMAITSLEEDDVQRMFQADKRELLGRYFQGCQQALLNASFMRNDDPICLQAFLLYLFAVRWFVDPRQVFCLIGIAVRIAQRMGLHRDPGGFEFPPFEVEQRRRLWWTIVGYDRRIGEMTGSTVTALSSGGDTKLPLNVNDSDLHVDGKELPKPYSGPTEMLFALTRIEIAMAVASNSNRDSHKMNNTDKPSPGGSGSSAQAPKQGPAMIKIAGQDSPSYTLDGFCAHVEGTYLAQCDPKIPLHFYTLTMTRQTLCKMRVIGYLVRMHDAEAMPLKEVERDSLFVQATQMIEYDNVVQSSDSLKPFRWYSMHHFPFPAYMFLVQELRDRGSGLLVERAWDAIALNHDLRTYLNYLHSPMHKAFGHLFLKAWDIFEAAQQSAGKHLATPRFIAILRERAEMRRKARLEDQPDPTLASGSSFGFPRSHPASDAPAPPSDGGGPSSMMTTPSHISDQPQGGAGAAAAVAPGPPVTMANMPPAAAAAAAAVADDQDMDWSYMSSGFQDSANMQAFSGFNSFGMIGAMPGMNGGGPPNTGPNVFGNN